MKNKQLLSRRIQKKTIWGLAVCLVLAISTCMLLGGDRAEVIEQEHFVAVSEKGSTIEKKWGTDPQLSAAPEGMLFAGWFTDASCETPVIEEEIDGSATYYAKYLDTGVLSIKLQLKSNEEKKTVDMRVVSSVDSLDYEKVGFVLYFGEDAQKEEEPITFCTDAVQKRISASASGVEYKFSPKVVNGDSAYFISGTIKGIVESKLSSYFYIKPFWTTLDGTTIYGENRYVSAQNGLDADNLNVPIKVKSNPADSDGNVQVIVGSKEVTAKLAAYKEGFAHLNVPVDAIPVGNSNVSDKEDLFAATKVALASDTDTFGVYRNYEGNGVAVDTSWYDVNPAAEEFVITTKADWEGLAKIVNDKIDTFTDQTVILVKDLMLSQGKVDATTGAWSGETVTTTQVGKLAMSSYSACTINTEKSSPFDGTFEGDGNTISGFYQKNGNDFKGLFTWVGENGKLQNFKLSNHYMGDTNAGWYLGSVASVLSGSINGIQADDTVVVGGGVGYYAGGLVGGIQGNVQHNITNCYFGGHISIGPAGGGLAGRMVGGTGVTIENCWIDGDIKGTSQVGGFIGETDKLTIKLEFTNCLFSGKVQGAGQTGGFLGREQMSIDYTDCLQNGQVTTSAKEDAGNIVGYIGGGSTANISHMYTTNKFSTTNSEGMTEASNYNGLGYIYSKAYGFPVILSDTELANENGYINTELDFWTEENTDGVWVATANGPELKQFSTAEAITDFSKVQRVSTGWYYEHYYNGVMADNLTYTIDTVEDLYGFAKMSETDNFKTDTVKLVKALDLNPGWSSESGVTDGVTIWEPIGHMNSFDGKFLGNGYTISGICIDGGAKDANGLFGRVSTNGVIQNLQIENSYISSKGVNGNGYWTGALVGRFGGSKIDSVYVGEDVIIYSDQPSTGGVVGQWHSAGAISNCWFAGDVTSQLVKDSNFVGGIVGNMAGGVNGGVIENCLNSGSVTGNLWHGGGIVGGTKTAGVNITLRHCLNTGTVMSKGSDSYFGAIIGGLENKDIVCNLEDVYTTTEAVHEEAETAMNLAMIGISVVSSSRVDPDGTNRVYGVVQQYKDAYLAGARAYQNTDFDFYSESNPNGVWAATSSGPELKQFTTKTVEQDFVDFRDDTTWYKNSCVNGTPSSTTLTITTAEQLYGLANLSQCYDFKGLTVKLGNNITVNAKGIANSNKLQWYPIGVTHEGTNSTPSVDGLRFSGVFDGNNKTISGIYMKQKHSYMGLFAGTEYGSVVKNLRLKDSYFEQLYIGNSRGTVGSIIADCRGDIDNVYSNATIVSNNNNAGGLVAWSNGVNYKTGEKTTLNITNCWYDGTMTVGVDGRYIGGITSMLRKGNLNIKNCLFSGIIDSAFDDGLTIAPKQSEGDVFVGGLFGTIDLTDSVEGNLNTLNIDSCISAGKITDANRGRAVGAVGGKLQWTLDGHTLINWTKLNMSNVFASRDCHANSVQYNWQYLDDAKTMVMDDRIQIEGYVIWSHGKDRLLGYCTEPGSGAELDFANDWSIVCSGVPLPKKLENVVSASSLTNVADLEYQVGLSKVGHQKLSDAIHMGMGNYVTTITSANYTDHYQKFITEMTTNRGYTVQSNNDAGAAVDGVYNTVLTKADGDWVLNITFVENMSTLYLSVNTGGASSVSKHLNYNAADSTTNYLAEGTITYTMGQLAKNASGNQFYFQLPNGHFIVNDGGHATDLEPMIKKLKSLASAANLDKVYIDAWIISHQHGDHANIFTQLRTLPSYMSDVYVEGIYLSEPNDATLALEDWAKRYTYGTGAVNNNTPITDFRVLTVEAQYAGMQTLHTSGGGQTPIYRFQTGQRYYFNGLTMDVIQTQDQLPILGKSVWLCEGTFNAVSTTLVYTLSSGEKIFIAGDATHLNSDYIMKAYDPTYAEAALRVLYQNYDKTGPLRCDPPVTGIESTIAKESKILGGIDVMTVIHHGMNTLLPYTNYLATETGGTVNGTHQFDVALMPYNQNRMTISFEQENILHDIDQAAYETQDYANEWILNYLVPDGKMFHYQYGDVKVTFKNGRITTSGTPITRTGRWD